MWIHFLSQYVFCRIMQIRENKINLVRAEAVSIEGLSKGGPGGCHQGGRGQVVPKASAGNKSDF